MLIAHSSFAQFFVFLDESTGLYGLKNGKGKVKVQAQYSQAKKLSTLDLVTDRHLRCVEKDGKWGILDLKTGKELCPLKYDAIKLADEGNPAVAIVQIDSKWGMINTTTGQELIPVILNKYPYFTNHYFIHRNDEGKCGMLSYKGVFCIPYKYDSIGYFSEKFAPVKLKDKWGFVDIEDPKSKVIIPIKYEAVGYFDGNLVAVKLKDKWGFVNNEGKVVIPIKYQTTNNNAPGFHLGAVELLQKDDIVYLNRKGEKVGKPYEPTPYVSPNPSTTTTTTTTTTTKTDTPKATHTWNCNKCGQSKQASDKPSDSGCRYKDSNGRDANGRHNWSK